MKTFENVFYSCVNIYPPHSLHLFGDLLCAISQISVWKISNEMKISLCVSQNWNRNRYAKSNDKCYTIPEANFSDDEEETACARLLTKWVSAKNENLVFVCLGLSLNMRWISYLFFRSKKIKNAQFHSTRDSEMTFTRISVECVSAYMCVCVRLLVCTWFSTTTACDNIDTSEQYPRHRSVECRPLRIIRT